MWIDAFVLPLCRVETAIQWHKYTKRVRVVSLYIHYINSTVFPSHRIIKIVIKRDEKYSPRLVIFVAEFERKRGRSDKGMER